MRDIFTVFALVSLLSPLSSIARAEDGSQCNADGNTSEMAACAQDDLAKEDKNLNKVYGAYLKKMQSLDADMVATPPDTAVGRLKAAQRAWIAFRDAECPLESVDNMGGSIEHILIPACLATLTKDRADTLAAQLKAFDAN